MKINFDPSLALVLKSEGGWVNNPHDPGGATMKGVTQRVFDAYCASKGLPAGSVLHITQPELEDIYRAQYWDAVRGDDCPIGIDYLLFDEGANSGPVTSIKDLQTALGVRVDGQFGLVTLGALNVVNDRAALINRVCDLRLNWLHRLKTWRFFGKGWSNRIAFVRANALKMVA